MSTIERVKNIFKDDLFPEQALNSKMSFNGAKFTDIMQIFEIFIALKKLMSKYNKANSTDTENIITELQQSAKDIKDYMHCMHLRFTSNIFVQKLQPKELDDAYWEVLLNDKSVLREHDFSKKFELATGFEIGDKAGLDPTFTQFEVFKIRLKHAHVALREAFSETH